MSAADVAKLSDRQLACLRLVGELKKTEQIADELGISPSTVNTHIERAMAVLGARSRREAAAMVRAAAPPASAPVPAVPDPRPEKHPTEFTRLSDLPPAAPSGAAAVPPEPVRRNSLTPLQRLGLAFLATVLLCLAIAGLGSAIEQLSAWRSSLAPAGTKH